MGNYSPLRYPGGKSALYPAISGIIKSNKMDHCIYVEPFAGGANIAWSLLIDGVVSSSMMLIGLSIRSGAPLQNLRIGLSKKSKAFLLQLRNGTSKGQFSKGRKDTARNLDLLCFF